MPFIAPKPTHYVNVIHITAEDSPNVKLARAQEARGLVPTGEIVVDGVMPWDEYQRRRKIWSPERQMIGLDARFWEGNSTLMYPPEYMARALTIGKQLHPSKRRVGKGFGIDTAGGGNNTSWCAVDDYGVIEGISKPTADTTIIVRETIAFGRKHGIHPRNWIFDAGYGGNDHAQQLRKKGFNCRAIHFGSRVEKLPKPTGEEVSFHEKLELYHDRYVYCNMRAQMHGELRVIMDPSLEGLPFAIGSADGMTDFDKELVRQMELLPLLWDGDGRMMLPPKNKQHENDKNPTLSSIMGCSPDELDSCVLAVHGMLYPMNAGVQAKAKQHDPAYRAQAPGSAHSSAPSEAMTHEKDILNRKANSTPMARLQGGLRY